MPAFSEKRLHIVSFNVPYPPDYGGVIDVYYKVKALAEAGVGIYLHCFQYNRPPAKALESLCYEVYYYPRQKWFTAFGMQPYIVHSRKSDLLINRLRSDDYPILFEGLHTCHYLNDKRLRGKTKMIRMHNIESRYYAALQHSVNSIFKKTYYALEALRLQAFERRLHEAHTLFAISPSEVEYLRQYYSHVVYLPPFHAAKQVTTLTGRGEYALYHADLSIAFNEDVTRWLAETVFCGIPIPLVVAGRQPSVALQRTLAGWKHVQLVADPSEPEMEQLMHHAHLHVVPAKDNSGFRLKLLHALFKGRFCVTNTLMAKGTGLEELCYIADTAQAMRQLICRLFEQDFSEEELNKRKGILETQFNNTINAQQLIVKLFPQG